MWGNYHRGLAAGLAGAAAAARSYFDVLLADPWDAPWALELKENTRALTGLLDDRERFGASARDLVDRSRLAKGLDARAWDWGWSP